MSDTLPSADKASGIRIENVAGSVRIDALGDIIAGPQNIYQNTYISPELVTRKALNRASPYRGLRRFEARDKDLFFGRAQLVAKLQELLGTRALLLVVGASGSGKSSVVRAGLLPAMTQRLGAGFHPCTFVPDVDPIESLRGALHAELGQEQTRGLHDGSPAEAAARLKGLLQGDGRQWLFFVDQFEELFTRCDEGKRRRFFAFLQALAEDVGRPVQLVFAMRADFLDRFGAFPEFAKLIEKNISIVADMHGDELRQAIELPAAHHGVVYEAGLVDEIIKDVQGQAGSLPLLQYTLDQLWTEEARRENGLEDRRIDATTYRDLGGVRGALQQRANTIFASFGGGAPGPSPRQEAVRRIFLRLVDLAGEAGQERAWRPVRRRVRLTSFAGPVEGAVLQELIAEKLLVSNGTAGGSEAGVEVAHEEIFHSWEHLRRWIEGAKQVIFIRNRLSGDADAWARRQAQDPLAAQDELLSGSRLGQILEMRTRGDFDDAGCPLDEVEIRFVEASAARRDASRQAEAERQRREIEKERQLRELDAARAREAEQRARDAEEHARAEQQSRRELERRGRRLRLALGLAGLCALVAGGAAYDSGKARQKADTNATTARQAAENLQKNQEKTQALLREASRADFVNAQDRLNRGEWQPAIPLLGRALRYDPENDQARIALWLALRYGDRIGAALPMHTFDFGDSRGFPQVRFSPDGAYVIVQDWRRCRIWDAASGQLLSKNLPRQNEVGELSVSADGRHAAVLYRDKSLVMWDPITGHESPSPIRPPLGSLRISPDGRRLITSAENGEDACLWDTNTGSVVRILGGVLMSENAVFSADGGRVLILIDGNKVRVLDVSTGLPLGPDLPHEWKQGAPALSADGRLLATFGAQNQVLIRDMTEGGAWSSFTQGSGPDDAITHAAFSPDARLLVTGGKNGIVRVVRAGSGALLGGQVLLRAGVRFVGFSPDGTRVLGVGLDGRGQLWRVGDNQVMGTPVNDAESVCFNPAGTRIVTASSSDVVQVWNAATRPVQGLGLHPGQGKVTAVAIDPGAARIATASVLEKSVQLWRAASGEADGGPLSIEFEPRGVEFSPDGSRLIISGKNTFHVWNLATREPWGVPIRLDKPGQLVDRSADASKLLTLSDDRTVQVWDVGTGKPQGKRTVVGYWWQAGLSADGRLAFTTQREAGRGFAEIWDAATGERVGDRFETPGSIDRIRFAADGGFLAVWTSEGGRRKIATGAKSASDLAGSVMPPLLLGDNYHFWSDGPGVCLATLFGPTRPGAALAGGESIGPNMPLALERYRFCDDNIHVVSHHEDGTTRFWDLLTSEKLSAELVEALAAFCSGARVDFNTVNPIGVEPGEREALHAQIEAGLPADSDWRFVARSYHSFTPDSPVMPRSSVTIRQAATRLILTGRESALHEALAADPGHPLIQIALAAFADDPIRKEFLRDFGLRRLPEDATFCGLAAGLLIDQGDATRAREAFDKAARLDSALPGLADLRARLVALEAAGLEHL